MRAVRRLVSRLGVQRELLGQSRPGQPLPLPLLVERGMELGEVPAEPAVWAWVREPHVSDVQSRAGEELLRCLPKPAQQVERVLARRLASRTQPGDRAAAERVIVALGVELCGLIPQLAGQVVPAHIPVAARIVDRAEERREVERGESIHVSHVRLPSPSARRAL